MSRKRPLDDSTPSSESKFAFASLRDREMFEIERNILTRIIYKNHYQYRRVDVLDRVKTLVKALDEFYVTHETTAIEGILAKIEWASERFFQQVTMGQMITFSLTCVASLARLAEILRRIPVSLPEYFRESGDEGIPVAR